MTLSFKNDVLPTFIYQNSIIAFKIHALCFALHCIAFVCLFICFLKSLSIRVGYIARVSDLAHGLLKINVLNVRTEISKAWK